MKKRYFLIPGALTGAVVLATGLYLFQPWRAVTSTTVSDRLVTATTGPAAREAAPAVLVAAGGFRSLEHESSGRAQLVRLPDGGHLVQFVGLDTSDGPDLHVYLSDKPASSEESAFGTGFISLGKLKGNLGDHVYPVAAGTDLTSVRSVVIWCKRFSAGFGVAPLESAQGTGS
ncbi:DM13 domain-containing protein [Amycolatopsis keratiniphila]|uniref:DM13 domain-containing protein n=1 Tax=Amycolatopsis keratiniphila subsp. keratiniphila TaxID=227715 RepID=A0A1W2LXP2_9PSEU|nr:DM13 domain-containing protein [Amycolatopsis keratiniphila]OLZ48653.1 hypothetical protein BS330_32825 [Amycolatopsis keratiniphila subsp. nogabecina]ONF71609.1 hypothetical protein AVR91_0213160 [Amycolatopsis keratiniphila subsp. keratiniphila]